MSRMQMPAIIPLFRLFWPDRPASLHRQNNRRLGQQGVRLGTSCDGHEPENLLPIIVESGIRAARD